MEKRKEKYCQYFFKQLCFLLKRRSLTEQRVFMVKYIRALSYHLDLDDITYCVSTRSVNQFIDSLDRLLYDVDFVCLFTCYLHVARLCGCERKTKTCLKPHQSKERADLHTCQCVLQ